MARSIKFTVHSTHTFTETNSHLLKLTLALPATCHLYVIQSPGHALKAYIGTSDNVKARFKPRVRALNEFGIPFNKVNGVHSVNVIHIQINSTTTGDMQPVQPNDHGKIVDPSTGTLINIEHLLSPFGRVKAPSFSWKLQHFFFQTCDSRMVLRR